ncbi:MAG: SDR family oxidoreductase [Candidatus Hydrogenedentes bacterium]|nr:SDR family oxidoreductase [Candidatus Hydrogenedentota bacterium]
MITLAEKTALVTGAAKRLGRATSLALANEGANIVVHYATSKSEAETLAHEIESAGVKAWTVKGNLANPAEAPELFERARSAAGSIELLVNNASIFPESTFAEFGSDEVHANIDLHAIAPAFLARALHRTGVTGAVVNMIDCMIADYDRKHLAYHLSKRMLHTLTRIMAVELAPRLRVSGVAPGLVLPPVGKDESYLATLASTNALNRFGSPEDIAATVVFLMKSDFIAGEVIYVDGGRNLRGSMYGG